MNCFATKLVFVFAIGTLVGCVSIPESKSETALVESVVGNPRIEGSFLTKGEGRRWNGTAFEECDGNLSYLFRAENERFGIKCDNVTFRKEADGSLLVTLENGTREHSRRFRPGSDFLEGPDKTILKLRRNYPEYAEVELHLAIQKNGQLHIVEQNNISTFTGVAVPVIPIHMKSARSYSFYPLISR